MRFLEIWFIFVAFACISVIVIVNGHALAPCNGGSGAIAEILTWERWTDMREEHWKRGIALTAAAGGMALALVAAPVSPDFGTLSLDPATAAAKGGQGESRSDGHGNRGGNGGGQGGGATNFVSGDANPGHGGTPPGQAKNGVDGVSGVSPTAGHLIVDGITADELKHYNAAHASAMGLSHASENSIVGMLGNYAEYLDDGLSDEELNTKFDEIFAGKYGPTDSAIIGAVDDLLTEGGKHEGVDRSLSN